MTTKTNAIKTTVKPNSLDDGRVGVSHFAVQHLFLCVCFFPVVFLYCFLVASVSMVSTIAGILLVANQRCLDRHALSYVWLLQRQTKFEYESQTTKQERAANARVLTIFSCKNSREIFVAFVANFHEQERY